MCNQCNLTNFYSAIKDRAIFFENHDSYIYSSHALKAFLKSIWQCNPMSRFSRIIRPKNLYERKNIDNAQRNEMHLKETAS